MRNIFKRTSLFLFILVIASCGMLSNDKFIYLGHGENSPDYQLYYDKTQKLFVLIDKRNGCFQKDDTGTCLAFTLKEAREFRKNVLAKMIEIDLQLAKDNHGSKAVARLQQAGITTINKPIKTTPTYATPVRQIVLDRKQQYHLVRREYEIDSNLVAMVVTNENGQKSIKVAYTVDFPGVEKNYNTKLRPFIIDPEYLYTHMTMDSVHEAQYMQKGVISNQEDVKKEVSNYLKEVVDNEHPMSKNQQQNIADKVAALDGGGIITDASMRNSEEAIDSGSSVKETPQTKTTIQQDPVQISETTLDSDNH